MKNKRGRGRYQDRLVIALEKLRRDRSKRRYDEQYSSIHCVSYTDPPCQPHHSSSVLCKNAIFIRLHAQVPLNNIYVCSFKDANKMN